jgi:hypothetical protein
LSTEFDAGDALDGNAIAGLLFEVFGAELTTAEGECANCGASGPVAEAMVYLRAPGTVVRCRSCRNVLMVLVTIRGTTSVDLSGLARLDRRLSRRLDGGDQIAEVPALPAPERN